MNSPRWILILSALVIGAPLPAAAQAWAHGSMFLDSRGLQHLHVSVGQLYGVSSYQVRQYHPGWLHPEEVPVLHLIAHEARVSPQVVLALREAGWSWWDISVHLRVRPRAFTAHLPYRPWIGSGYADWQIVEWVNVGFWARVYHRPVREVIVIRERVPTWTHVIHHYTPTVVVYHSPPTYVAPPRANPVVQGRTAPAPQAAPPPRQAVPRTAPGASSVPGAAQGARVSPQSQPQPRGGSAASGAVTAPAQRAPTPAAARSAAPPPPPAAARSQGQAPAPAARSPAAAQAPAQVPAPSPRAAPVPTTRAAPPPPAPAARGGGAERRPAVRPPSGLER